MFDVVISYRRKGGFYLAQIIHDYLLKRGITSFFDYESIKRGDYLDYIYDAIDEAPNFVFVVTPGSLERCTLESDIVYKEANRACLKKKNIIPLFLDYTPSADLIANMPTCIQEVLAKNGVTSSEEYLNPMIDKIVKLMVDVDVKNINFAVSNLTVVDSLIQGFDESIFEKYRCKIEKIPYEWNDNILKDLESGKIDVAIYNKESALKYNKLHDNCLKIVKDVCSSMGGRNFYVLAHKNSKWKNMSLTEFKNALDKDTIISVAENSDRFKNLLFVLNMTKEDLLNKGVRIINQNDSPSLDIFMLIPDILLIGGQDIRFVADKRGEFFEVLSFDDFETDKQIAFYKNSINSLIVGPTGLSKLSNKDLEEIAIELMASFYKNAMNVEKFNVIKNRLTYKNKAKYSESEAEYVLKRILFETYRLL